MTYPTLSERKCAKVAAMADAVEVLARDLAEYAREHGGRFTIFGSAARGQLRYHSDVDILVDFPSRIRDDAWALAESRAFALGLVPDILHAGFAGANLRVRIAAEGRRLP